MPGCEGIPETLSHLFLTCPLSQGVWRWLLAVWLQVAGPGQSGPPLAATVLLCDDQRAWRPPPEIAYLWTHLRLAALAAIWAAAARRSLRGDRTTAAQAAAAVLADTRRAVMADWSRVAAGDLEGVGVFTGWVRGRPEGLRVEAFRARWCYRGALCGLVPDVAAPKGWALVWRWTAMHPVPLPT